LIFKSSTIGDYSPHSFKISQSDDNYLNFKFPHKVIKVDEDEWGESIHWICFTNIEEEENRNNWNHSVQRIRSCGAKFMTKCSTARKLLISFEFPSTSPFLRDCQGNRPNTASLILVNFP